MSDEKSSWKNGMMEHWNIVLEKKYFDFYALFQHSIIPE